MGSLSDKDMAAAKAQAAKLLAPAQASEKADSGASTSGAGSEGGVVEPEVKIAEKEVYKDSPAEIARKEHGRAKRSETEAEKSEREAIKDLVILKAKRPYFVYHKERRICEEAGVVFKNRLMPKDELIERLEGCYEEPVETEVPPGMEKLYSIPQQDLSVDGSEDLTAINLLHTLESAKLDLKRMKIKPKEVRLWVEKDEYGGDIVVNLFPESVEAILPVPEDLSDAQTWDSLIYNDGLRDVVYLIPPPPRPEGIPPIIEDVQWESVVENTRKHMGWIDRSQAIKLLSAELPISIGVMDSGYKASSGNTSLNDADPDSVKKRKLLALAMKEMGLLQYDGQNGMCYLEGDFDHHDVAEDLLSATDTYSVAPEQLYIEAPRSYWRDLPQALQEFPNESDELRDKIRHLLWLAFEAGREAEGYRIVKEMGELLRQMQVIIDKQFEPGKSRRDHTEVLLKAVQEFHDDNPDVKVTEKKVRDFIYESGNEDYVTAYETLSIDITPQARVNSLNGVIRRWWKTKSD